jgi:hypothetical protein
MRRRRVEPAGAPTADDVPECLRAGPCIEVWAHGRTGPGFEAPWWAARRAYLNARDLWREAHGIDDRDYARLPDVLKRSSRPWSFAYLSQEPERLAQILRYYDLPPDWQPTPAPPEWRTTTPRRSP